MLDSTLNSNKSELTAVEVYTKHADFIRRVIRSRVKDEYQADDIFQDLFLRLVANPIRLEIEDVERYLYRAAVNQVIDSARRKKPDHTGVVRQIDDVDIASREVCPEDSVIDADEVAKTFRLIRGQCSQDEMPKKQSQALYLYCNKGYRIKEIAQTMGVKSSSASYYVSKGLAKVRRAAAVAGGNML